ncbi:unnamed protein product [Tenebrio molitor]|nr:unnamed protein product [Tenebrio molitor]
MGNRCRDEASQHRTSLLSLLEKIHKNRLEVTKNRKILPNFSFSQ